MAITYDEKTSGADLVKEYSSSIKGKTILVVGTSLKSIGHLYSQAVAEAEPATLIVAGRTPKNVLDSAEAIRAAHPKVLVKELIVDYGSLKSVRQAAAEINEWKDVPHIDVFVNSAAIMATPYRKTEDGHESQWQTNFIAPFLFTNLIAGKIMASETPRIVLISSGGCRYSAVRWGDYNFSDGKTYDKWTAYGQSKSALNLTAVALAKRLGDKGLRVYSLHPGVVVSSNLSRDLDFESGADYKTMQDAETRAGTKYMHGLGGYGFKSEDQIIATPIFASFTDTLEGWNGHYLVDCRAADQWKDEVWPWTIDRIEAERVWDLGEKLLGEKFNY